MFTNRIREIPLPIPRSLIFSPIHMMIAAPAQWQARITIMAKVLSSVIAPTLDRKGGHIHFHLATCSYGVQDEIYIDGVLREDHWKKDGQYCSTIYILAYDVFFGQKKQTDAHEEPEQPHEGIPELPADPEEALIKVEDTGDLPF